MVLNGFMGRVVTLSTTYAPLLILQTKIQKVSDYEETRCKLLMVVYFSGFWRYALRNTRWFSG